MTDAPRPAAKATQKVVAAMWTMQQPATAQQIAEAAAVGYSTVTPILRNLHAEQQATKTDTDGRTLWHLTAGNPTAALNLTATASAAESIAPDDVEPSGPAPDSADLPQPDRDANPAQVHDTAASADTPTADDASEEEPSAMPNDAVPAATPSAPIEAATAEQQEATPQQIDTRSGIRPYRKPEQPRRAKGALRDAVLKVLTGAPETEFKVGEVCKAIDAANTDATANKAGAGAVANALTKLVTDGHALQVVEKPATFQAARPAETD